MTIPTTKAFTWPSAIEPSRVTIQPIRAEVVSNSNPLTGEETTGVSPWARHEARFDFQALQGRKNVNVQQAIRFIRAAEAPGRLLRLPLLLPGLPTSTANLAVTFASGSTAIITDFSGNPSRPLVNGGAGFRAGDIISFVDNDTNYVYTVAQDQTHNTQVVMTSRLRGPAVTVARQIFFRPAFIEGRVIAGNDVTRDEAAFFEFSLGVRETA